MAKLLEQISGEEALKILRLLSAQDQDIENRIEELAENILKDARNFKSTQLCKAGVQPRGGTPH